MDFLLFDLRVGMFPRMLFCWLFLIVFLFFLSRLSFMFDFDFFI